ncbi:substrate-binding periplasmic protein [Photobacterium atrarenae]|uniref:Transporter substrate-binding domain-containing protein n=1 Tax=Photobacterium atrarenae TaxID=865757 RepID=A0ABY5GKZ7_9GAMM|nr:transporter substrate-binding domain-containing protein [Photobacterium atrarenae]UTV29789.1 transporter substrate-binding domain-containing protein [Photobacterium atrarenae]
MKKIYSVFSALAFASVSFSLQAGSINYYVIAKQATPFQIEEGKNNHSGIVTDIVKAVFEDSPYNINYHTYPFNRMISLLEAGGEPNWITYGSPEWGKVQSENLSEIPIYTVKHVLVSNHNSTIRFESIADMQQRIIVLLHGFDYPQLLPYFEQGEIEELRVKDYQAAFRIINKFPEYAAFVEMESRVKYNLAKLNETLTNYQIQPFRSVIPDYPIYLAFDPKMSPKVQKFINQRLKELKSSGRMDDIIHQYL